MPAYFVADVRVTDPQEFQKYASQVPELIARFGGHYIGRGAGVDPMEGDWKPETWVIVEFPTLEALQGWYNSPEYQSLLQIRLRSAVSNAVSIKGV